MAVDPSETAAYVQGMLERRSRALAKRAAEARRIAETLAVLLVKEYGAKRVMLHGSLAHGSFHERSDIDLVVEGLSPTDLLDAGVALDDRAAPFNLDLISLERQPEGLRKRIEEHGIALP